MTRTDPGRPAHAGQRIGRRAVLYPTDDAGAIFLAEHGDALRQAFAVPGAPCWPAPPAGGQVLDAPAVPGTGVPCPAATVPAALDEARDFAAGAGYPAHRQAHRPVAAYPGPGSVVRPSSVPMPSSPPYGMPARSSRRRRHAPGVHPRGPPGDWFFHGYWSASFGCRPAFTGLKHRSYPAHAGLTSLGRAVANRRARHAGDRHARRDVLPRHRRPRPALRRRGTPSTSCWISTRGWARSSGCSPSAPAWTSCSRRTWTLPARRCPRAPS